MGAAAARAALVLVVLLAGCVGAPSPGPASQDATSAAARFLPAVAPNRDAPGAEPVIAALPDGTLFVEGVGSEGTQNVNKVLRSTDHGKSWSDVTPPGPGELRSNDGFVATGNGGSVYAANVFSLSLQVFRSDDKGASWTPLPVPRVPALMHRHWILPVGTSTIHVAVEALPAWYLPKLGGASSPVPFETPNQGMWYFRSDDKGMTWTTPVQIDPNVNFAGQGNLVASADGKTLAVLRYEETQSPVDAPKYEKGHWYLVVSEDGGASWKRRDAFDLTSELAAALPATAMAPDGAIWAMWSQEANGTSSLHVAVTKDKGASWSAPRRLETGLSGAQAMPWVAAKSDGSLALVWYQADQPGRASKLNASWDGVYADVRDGALVGSPLVVAPRLHAGNICAKGPACASGEDRRLLDYPWVVVGAKGDAQAVFASTAKPSKASAFAVVAVEAQPSPS